MKTADESYKVQHLPETGITPDRLSRLVTLFRRLGDAEDGYDAAYGLKTRKPSDTDLRKWLLNRKGGIYAASGKDGKLLGFAVSGNAQDYDHANYISALSVDPAFRGRGIGREILEKIVRDNRSKKRRSLLRVSLNNPAGLRLYGSLGFKPVNQTMVLDERQEKRAAVDPQALRIKAYALNAFNDIRSDPSLKDTAAQTLKELTDYPIDWESVEQLRREGYFPESVKLDYVPYFDKGLYFGGYTPGCPGAIDPTIVLSTNGQGQVSRSVAAHEAGHARDYERLVREGKISGNDVDPSNSLNLHYGISNDSLLSGGFSRTPLSDYLSGKAGFLARERAGWDQATGRYDPRMRELALKSYENNTRRAYVNDYLQQIKRPIKERRLNKSRYDSPDVIQQCHAPLSTVKDYMETRSSVDAVKLLNGLLDRVKQTQFDYRGGVQK